MLREESKWRIHENESAEKYLNLEKHQDAADFPAKDGKIFSKSFMALKKINKIKLKLDLY